MMLNMLSSVTVMTCVALRFRLFRIEYTASAYANVASDTSENTIAHVR